MRCIHTLHHEHINVSQSGVNKDSQDDEQNPEALRRVASTNKEEKLPVTQSRLTIEAQRNKELKEKRCLCPS